MKLAILSLILFTITASAFSDKEVCNSYLAAAEDLGCDSKNYLVKFAYRYCSKFIEKEHIFSEKTQMTLNSIRNCLISDILEDNRLTCENAQIIGRKSHVNCYIQNGFCDISSRDKFKILWIIKSNFLTEFKSVRKITKACL